MEKETATHEVEEIRQRLRDSIDPYRRNRIMALTRRFLAISQTDVAGDVVGDNAYDYNALVSQSFASAGGTIWPHYEAFRPSIREFSKINFMQNALRKLTEQARTIDLVPQWINCDNDVIAQARRQYYVWRSQGSNDGLGDWKTDLDNVYNDYAALGEGYLRLGLCEADKGYATTLGHYHPLNVMVDPYAKYPNESRWVCFSTVYSQEEAEEKFPDFDFDEYTQGLYRRQGVRIEGIPVPSRPSQASRNTR